VLSTLDLRRSSPELRDRVREVVRELERGIPSLGGPGLEHDVDFLATVDDPRALDRLRRILSGVSPFSKSGFPDAGPRLSDCLRGWWAYSKTRVR
jgi:hypothetical protein